MGIEVTCDECCKTTDEVICVKCADKKVPPSAPQGTAEFDEFALHDLAPAIARGERDDAFAALDRLVRDHPHATAARERIAIAKASA